MPHFLVYGEEASAVWSQILDNGQCPIKVPWNFEVYCGKIQNSHDDNNSHYGDDNDMEGSIDDVVQHLGRGEGFARHNVVKILLKDLSSRGPIVAANNYFTLVPLYLDLLQRKTMATGILWTNRKYIPKAMFAKENTIKREIEWINYRMHEEGKICGRTSNQ